MSEYAKPLPTPSPDSKPFWDACREERLTCQRCGDCAMPRFPPSRTCPNCLSQKATWETISGKGSVFSFTVFRREYHPGFAADVPYVVALIELEEGPRMLSNLIGVDPDDVRCGVNVQVRFDRVTDQITLPKFTLSGS